MAVREHALNLPCRLSVKPVVNNSFEYKYSLNETVRPSKQQLPHHGEGLAGAGLSVREYAHVEAVQNGHHHGGRVREHLRLVSLRVKDPVKLKRLFVPGTGPRADQQLVLALDVEVDDVGLPGGDLRGGQRAAAAEDADVAWREMDGVKS